MEVHPYRFPVSLSSLGGEEGRQAQDRIVFDMTQRNAFPRLNS
jgi:hypothetical protein